MKLDVLALAAHPDDAELSASGTLAKMKAMGKRVGVIDFTRGELGTRGSAEIRAEEAAESSRILGLDVRGNLGMADGFFEYNKENQMLIIEQIRRYRPDVVLCNAPSDRHPDHGKGSRLAVDACFLSGLRKIESSWGGDWQEAWRPKAVYHYIQDHYLEPSFVVDITEHWDTKIASIKAFSSQFFDPKSKEPISPIATEEFLDFIEGRSLQFGRQIGKKYGEGFISVNPLEVKDITKLV